MVTSCGNKTSSDDGDGDRSSSWMSWSFMAFRSFLDFNVRMKFELRRLDMSLENEGLDDVPTLELD